MASNTNKRYAIKWVRDLAKKAYEKDTKCFICGTSTDLELHHTNSLNTLLEDWAKEKNYDISTDEGICEVRQEFIDTFHKEIYDEVFTLCNSHHVALHSIYGKSPPRNSSQKQIRWLNIRRDKFLGNDMSSNYPTSTGSFFSAFIK